MVSTLDSTFHKKEVGVLNPILTSSHPQVHLMEDLFKTTQGVEKLEVGVA